VKKHIVDKRVIEDLQDIYLRRHASNSQGTRKSKTPTTSSHQHLHPQSTTPRTCNQDQGKQQPEAYTQGTTNTQGTRYQAQDYAQDYAQAHSQAPLYPEAINPFLATSRTTTKQEGYHTQTTTGQEDYTPQEDYTHLPAYRHT